GNRIKLSAARSASFLHVCFLKMEPARESIEKMSEAYTGPEEIQVVGRECYIYYPDGAGKSRLNLERWLKVAATARNWNTVNRLAELAASLQVRIAVFFKQVLTSPRSSRNRPLMTNKQADVLVILMVTGNTSQLKFCRWLGGR